MFLLFGFVAVFGDGGSVLGMGDSEVCVEGANIPMIGDDLTAEEIEIIGLKENARSYEHETTVCNTEPGLKEQALTGLSTAPTFLVFIGFLILTNRSIKQARASGLFTAETARRVQHLGRFLLIGLVAAAFIEWIAKGLLLGTMVEGKGWADGPPYISVPALIGALGVVTVGRVLARAVELQNDADTTV